MRISRSCLGYCFFIKMKVTRQTIKQKGTLLNNLIILDDLLYFSVFYDLDRRSKRKRFTSERKWCGRKPASRTNGNDWNKPHMHSVILCLRDALQTTLSGLEIKHTLLSIQQQQQQQQTMKNEGSLALMRLDDRVVFNPYEEKNEWKCLINTVVVHAACMLSQWHAIETRI